MQIPGNLIGEHFQQVQQTLTALGFKVVGQQQSGFGQKVTSISPSGQAPARQHDHRDLRRVRRVVF